ncbi:MAG: hypothetical protein BIFFINMI_03701 [Phycisphaerae bacterium]|nr:hypothetical protein [Phycisphaerae bacterium]
MKGSAMSRMLWSAVVVALLAYPASAETLKVGPGQKYARPSQAIAAAKEGDVVEIDTKGDYAGDVTYVRANNLTVRGVGEGRAVLDAQGKSAGRKGIFVTVGKDITVENIDFRNAGGEVNAAGIRAEGENLTVRNCRFYNNRDAILGGAGVVLIEHCVFDHNGLNSRPATHNLYMSERVTRLIYRYNYSTHTVEGHLLKSRAAENWVLYNRLTDEEGTGSAVADFPNGGVVVLVGNILQKGPKGQNNRVVAYGMEGIKHKVNALVVVNNTMVWQNRRAWEFVHVQSAPEDFVPIIRNNLCAGNIPLTNWKKIDAAGNLVFKTVAEAGFVDAEKFDYHLKADSPAVGKAVACGRVENVAIASPAAEPIADGKAAAFDLTAALQYTHPAGQPTLRLRQDKPDVGAFGFAPVATTQPNETRIQMLPGLAFLDGQLIAHPELTRELIRRMKSNPELAVVLKPDSQTPWREVLALYNAIVSAGVRNVQWAVDRQMEHNLRLEP